MKYSRNETDLESGENTAINVFELGPGPTGLNLAHVHFRFLMVRIFPPPKSNRIEKQFNTTAKQSSHVIR